MFESHLTNEGRCCTFPLVYGNGTNRMEKTMEAINRPTPDATRGQLVLAVVADFLESRDPHLQQVRIQVTRSGEKKWAFTFHATDTADVVQRVADREVDVASINPSVALTMAYRGTGPFKTPVPVRAITVIPSKDWLAFAITEASGIKSLADIKAKRFPLRVSLRGRPNHPAHILVDAALAAYGFSLDDVKRWGGDVSYDPEMPRDDSRLGKVKRGEIDAIFDEGVRRFIPLAIDAGMRFLPLDEPVLRQLESMGLRRGTLTKQQFPSLPMDVPTLDFSGWPVYTHAEVSAELIYRFCQSLEKRKSTIVRSEPGDLPLETMCRDTPDGPLDVPLHAGAEKYWREAGYLP